MSRLLCLIGLHNWHPTTALREPLWVSKTICTRCGVRQRWRS